MDQLRFGYNKGIPDGGVTAAWGCRAIVDQDGMVDVVPDRTDCVGADDDRHRLLVYLNDRVGFDTWRGKARDLLRDCTINTRVAGEHVLFTDDTVTIKCNTSGSGGYLYVCAFFNAGKRDPARIPGHDE